MIVALRMRVVSTGKHYWMMSADYANETQAISAALKLYPGCVVSRVTSGASRSHGARPSERA
jgi:hypothetical protein